MPLFDGFDARHIETTSGPVFVRTKGEGPPLLLLHGYPQTHAMWHSTAPALAERFSVVCADLRGYGDSLKPERREDHVQMSKRAMAADLVEAMAKLGHERFMVAGHDRGGRVTHRMCLDHKDKITKAAVLDIVPTRTLFEATSMPVAMGYYHWYFLAQPYDFPERLIGGDPLYYLHAKLGSWSGGKSSGFAHPDAMTEYERCFADPATIHCSCEDYRAAASIDLVHDRADETARIACPLLVLWGRHGLMEKHFDVLATWREKAEGPVEGEALDCGHYLPEEAPAAVAARLEAFFAGS
jgi:haloacetate dehalogenase